VFLDIADLQAKIGRDPGDRSPREPREPRHAHTPQFLQRSAAPRSPVTTVAADDDEFEDD
jgi:hypothetical protein